MVRLLNGVSADADGRWLVVDGADLESRQDRHSPPTVGARCPVLGERNMIPRLTATTAELVGETAAEWELLEKRTRLTRVYVTRLEAGKQDPSLSTINALAKALRAPVTALLE